MADLNRLRTSIDRAVSNQPPHVQAGALNALLSQIDQFLTAMSEYDKLAQDITELKHIKNRTPKTDEETAEREEALALLPEAESAKREFDNRKQTLRTLEGQLNDLLAKVRRILR